MKVSLSKITLAVVFCISLLFSCSSDIELPPPPLSSSSSSSSGVVVGSSSSISSGGISSSSSTGSEASSSSSSVNSSGISSSSRTAYYCDFGPRHTCPDCEGGVGGGCFEMENQYDECDSRYGTVATFCSIGLVCDYGPIYYDASRSDCGEYYCGGCYKITSSGQSSCVNKYGNVNTSCPESSLLYPSSSSGSLPTCQYKSSWCGGTSLANVKYNYSGYTNCQFIKGISADGGSYYYGIPLYVNGNSFSSGSLLSGINSLTKVDGGYYIYSEGYSIDISNRAIGGAPDCNVNAM